MISSEECCENAFDNKPIFTSKGVCYTSKIREPAESASEFDGMDIWVTSNRADFQFTGRNSIINQMFLSDRTTFAKL